MPVPRKEDVDVRVADARAIPNLQVPSRVQRLTTHCIRHTVLEGNEDKVNTVLPLQRLFKKRRMKRITFDFPEPGRP